LLQGLATIGRAYQSLVVITPSSDRAWVDRIGHFTRGAGRLSSVLNIDADTFEGRVAPSNRDPWARLLRGRPAPSITLRTDRSSQLQWWTIPAGCELFEQPRRDDVRVSSISRAEASA
jgi:hypothetical protein